MLLTTEKAQKHLRAHFKAQRLAAGLTQKGLAVRAGVKLPTLRRFEQTGFISLESFLKLLMALGLLDDFVQAIKPKDKAFSSIDIDKVLRVAEKMPKRGWRT